MNTWIISGIILVIGFLICLFLILRNKWKVRKKHIKDYEEGRDKLTPEVEKANEKILESEEPSSSGFRIGNIISGFIALLIGLTLIGPISEQIQVASNATNSTYVEPLFATSTILNLVPIFFAIAIVTAVIAMLTGNSRIGGSL